MADLLSMNDLVIMKVAERVDHLVDKVLSFRYG